ncbi:MAG TPA: hypothetical protein VMU39_24150, partial [Solirubrobacteraceae bacterium]|nr:hypothetical protein [Solirubrobacteraceae bacterium]
MLVADLAADLLARRRPHDGQWPPGTTRRAEKRRARGSGLAAAEVTLRRSSRNRKESRMDEHLKKVEEHTE